jgi:acyl-CoA thioesterase
VSLTTGRSTSTPTIDSVLDAATVGHIPAAPELWGHGGLHGGLTLAALTAAAGTTEGHRLRAVTGQFLRPLQDASSLEADELRRGRTVRSVAVRATTDGSVRATAVVTSGRAASPTTTTPLSAPAPIVPPPSECDVLAFPDENASIVDHIEIRPATGGLPFSGSNTAELTAWVSLTDHDRPPDDLRLIVLADAIAASYTAMLSFLALTPTVELSVSPTGHAAVSPWVLVQTRATAVTEDGWIDERIELWDGTGTHLASARQVRVLIPL